MSPAAYRFAAAVALVFSSACVAPLPGADLPPRQPPTRPGETASSAPSPLASVRIEKSDYVDLEEAVIRLGLKPQPREATRKVFFGDKSQQLVVEPESREALVNGLRVFLGEKIVARKGRLYLSKIDFFAKE